MVVRAWPPDGPGRPDLERIHRWLAEAGGLGFVPVPIPAMDGRTIRDHAGLLWEVSPWHPGRADIGRPPPRPRLRAGLTALAAFHQVLARDRIRGQSPGLQARFHELNWLSMGGFEVLEGAIDRAPAEPVRAPARQWLELARRAAPRILSSLRRASARVVALQPCLRDARPEHLLFTGEQVTGLVDFGAMAIECVAADLARSWPSGSAKTARHAPTPWMRMPPSDPWTTPSRTCSRSSKTRPTCSAAVIGSAGISSRGASSTIPRPSSGACNEASIGRPDCSDTVGRSAEWVTGTPESWPREQLLIESGGNRPSRSPRRRRGRDIFRGSARQRSRGSSALVRSTGLTPLKRGHSAQSPSPPPHDTTPSSRRGR